MKPSQPDRTESKSLFAHPASSLLVQVVVVLDLVIISRAEHTVLQTQIELSGLKKQALSQVERACLDSFSSGAA